MYYIYILRCVDDTLYTGITTDLRRRFAEHCSSCRGAKYTRTHRPAEIAAAWTALDRSGALRLEARIKALSRPAKLRLIAGEDTAASLPGDWVRIPPSSLPEGLPVPSPEQ